MTLKKCFNFLIILYYHIRNLLLYNTKFRCWALNIECLNLKQSLNFNSKFEKQPIHIYVEPNSDADVRKTTSEVKMTKAKTKH